MIKTHRNRVRFSPGRKEAAGPAGHRQGFLTPTTDSPIAGSPARPERRFPKAFGLPMALRRGAWLALPRIATPRAPGRKPWETVSMSHNQGPLVLRATPSNCRLHASTGPALRAGDSGRERRSPRSGAERRPSISRPSVYSAREGTVASSAAPSRPRVKPLEKGAKAASSESRPGAAPPSRSRPLI